MEVKFIEAQFAHEQNNFDVILCFVVKSTELHGFARHWNFAQIKFIEFVLLSRIYFNLQ